MTETNLGKINWNDYEYFSEDEFRCRCGCGRADMDAHFVEILNYLRKCTGPIVITSGFRCPDYNDRISHTGRDGPHTTGKAADLGVHGWQAMRIIHIADHRGIHRMGIHQKGDVKQRFIHLDTSDKHPSPAIWTY